MFIYQTTNQMIQPKQIKKKRSCLLWC